MKVETQPLENHQVSMLVEADAEQFESARRRAARKIAGQAKIPGFRPGKAPFDVVRRTYGDQAINEEAIEFLVDEIYPAAIEQAGIKAGAAGSLENVESLDPPKFKFVIPLYPEIDLGDYRSIRKEYAFDAPDETKVTEELENLRRMYSKTEAVERAIESGDFLMINIKGAKDAIPEGENPLVVDRQNHAVYVAKEERDNDFPYKGFPQELIGLKVGDIKTFMHTFAADDEDESLRGAVVKYEVEIKTVRGVELPELNDEFAKQVGGGETVDELRENIRKSLEAQAKADFDDKFYAEVIDIIKAGATIKYPPQVIDHEVEHVVEDLKGRLAQEGMEFETYLKMRQMDLDQFTAEEARPVAAKRLERGLIMDEIARVEKIELDEQSLGDEFNQTWATLSATDEKFSKMTKGGTKGSKELVDAVAMESANRLMTRRVLERIKAIATGVAELPAAEPQPFDPAQDKPEAAPDEEKPE